ncbi:MAG: hypothetical protein IT450_23610 [Phycisphaerales bacterium]|nr:hypothetical protein [Phycisphaerales bacterium]
MMTRWAFVVVASLALVTGIAACRQNRPAGPSPDSGGGAVAPEAPEHVIVVEKDVISGGEPRSTAEFEWLRQQGVKTVISVDGMKPDAETARRYGIRYVHLPIRYSGVPADRRMELAKAIHDLPGPVYVHCHHGLHRGPAAVAAALVTLGRMTPEEGTAFLKRAGTSSNYPGLFGDVAGGKAVTSAELDAYQCELPERWQTVGIVDAMAEIDRAFERLGAVREAGWKTPPDHPDVVGANEATLLMEHFHELLREDEKKEWPADYRTWLSAAETAAEGIRSELKGGRSTEALDRNWTALKQTCSDCHAKYRNLIW